MKQTLESGQMLVMLLIYMVVAVMITTASVSMLVVTTQSSEKINQGSGALDIAESGAETAMIKLLRDPTYIGETMTITGGQAIVSVSGSNPKTVISEGVKGNFRRKIEVVIQESSNVMTVESWREIN